MGSGPDECLSDNHVRPIKRQSGTAVKREPHLKRLADPATEGFVVRAGKDPIAGESVRWFVTHGAINHAQRRMGLEGWPVSCGRGAAHMPVLAHRARKRFDAAIGRARSSPCVAAVSQRAWRLEAAGDAPHQGQPHPGRLPGHRKTSGGRAERRDGMKRTHRAAKADPRAVPVEVRNVGAWPRRAGSLGERRGMAGAAVDAFPSESTNRAAALPFVCSIGTLGSSATANGPLTA